MTDDTFPEAAADEEALSAYLAGDLPDEDARAFERRLQSDPQLATRLDALAQALVALGGFDDAGVPAGYDERLEARLAQERATAASGAPIDLAARRRRRDRSRVWLGVGTAAAVLAAGAVVAGSSLQGMGGGGDAAVESGASGDTGVALEQAEGGGTEGLRAPVLLDTQVALADEASLREHFSDLPEARALLGMPVEEARVLQDEFTAVTGRSAGAPAPLEAPRDTSAQTEAGSAEAGDESAASADSSLQSLSARDVNRCLETITANQTPLVPVRVESVRYDGRPAVAYVLVTASRGSDELDRTQVWVVQPNNCATLAFQQY